MHKPINRGNTSMAPNKKKRKYKIGSERSPGSYTFHFLFLASSGNMIDRKPVCSADYVPFPCIWINHEKSEYTLDTVPELQKANRKRRGCLSSLWLAPSRLSMEECFPGRRYLRRRPDSHIHHLDKRRHVHPVASNESGIHRFFS